MSELKSKNGQQSEHNLQDVDADEEEQLKQAMDQIDIKAPPAAGVVVVNDQISVEPSQALTKS